MRSITAAVVLMSALTSLAFAEDSKIEGYEGYKFGMTLDRAQRVNPRAKQTQCDYHGVVTCLEYPIKVGAFSGMLSVQFAGAPAVISAVLLTFRALDEPLRHSCQQVGKELLGLLIDKYGTRVFTEGKTVTWTFPEGGSVEFTTLCVGSTGVNIISYQPSNPL